ncbi:Uncharacterised protein [uncultured archaeon]|nr:Uncharacterised protein [uncultured archaeon]
MSRITEFLRNPVTYGILGLMLVAVPMLFFFFAGLPYTGGGETQYANGSKTVFTGTVWMGAFNPVFLIFIFGAAVAAWGCYRNTLMACTGSLFVLALSILAMFSIGILLLPGAIFLLTGAVFRTIKTGKTVGEK